MNRLEYTQLTFLSENKLDWELFRIHLKTNELFTMKSIDNATHMKLIAEAHHPKLYNKLRDEIHDENTIIDYDNTKLVVACRTDMISFVSPHNRLLRWALRFSAVPKRQDKGEGLGYRRSSVSISRCWFDNIDR